MDPWKNPWIQIKRTYILSTYGRCGTADKPSFELENVLCLLRRIRESAGSSLVGVRKKQQKNPPPSCNKWNTKNYKNNKTKIKHKPLENMTNHGYHLYCTFWHYAATPHATTMYWKKKNQEIIQKIETKTFNYASTRSRAWPAEVAGRFVLAELPSTTDMKRPASELGPLI